MRIRGNRELKRDKEEEMKVGSGSKARNSSEDVFIQVSGMETVQESEGMEGKESADFPLLLGFRLATLSI